MSEELIGFIFFIGFITITALFTLYLIGNGKI